MKAAREANERVAKEAATMQERFKGWAFALPSFSATTMRSTMSSLLKPLGAPTPPATETRLPAGPVPIEPDAPRGPSLE